MPLANCPRCKKLFNKVKLAICTACEAEEEADFEKVRRSLHDKPNQTAEEVAEATGVSQDCVLRLLDEGRIANVSLADAVTCGRCGAPAISLSKRLCQDCLNRLSVELAAEQSKIQLPGRKSVSTESTRAVREIIDDKRKP